MRFYFFALFLLMIHLASHAQNDSIKAPLEESLPLGRGCITFIDSSHEAQKNCTQSYILQHISQNFRYPSEARKMGVTGRVFVNFVVEKDGSVGDVHIIRGAKKNYFFLQRKKRKLAESLDREALRVVNTMRFDKPALQDGDPVRMSFTVPINARMPE